MRRFATVVSAILLAGCGTTDKPAPPPATPAPPPAPAPISMADVAGTWTFKTMAVGSDSVLVTYTLKATASDTGWTVTFPNRKPMAMHVMISADSIVSDVAPYPSVLRKGVTVSTHGVFRLKDGKMTGMTVAHYSAGRDTVTTLRTEGTKNP
jgi:hypothetical protein